MPTFCNGKITKKYDKPDEFETSIGQTLVDLETNSDLKDLRDLTISGAKQIDVGDKKVLSQDYIHGNNSEKLQFL